MKFIADAMCGRLAKRLRLLGFDTAYQKDITDSELIKTAIKDHRVILTRDTRLKNKDNLQCLIVKSDHAMEQVTQVLAELNLSPLHEMRCSVCNGELIVVLKDEDLKASVPAHVYATYSRFARCGGCGRVYWEGSHYDGFKKELEVYINRGHA